MRPRILVVDDDRQIVRQIEILLRPLGATAIQASDIEHGLELLRRCPLDIVLANLTAHDDGGRSLVGRMQKIRPGLPVIAVVEKVSIASVVESFRAGVTDYLQKPIRHVELANALARAIAAVEYSSHGAHDSDASRTPGEVPCEHDGASIVAASAVMRQLLDRAQSHANSQHLLLLSGEHGTGKERLARWIHARSRRHEQPFVTVRCDAVAAERLVELFFGGENAIAPGLVERASGGTLFLRNVVSLPAWFQRLLAKTVRSGAIARGGDRTPGRSPARLIASIALDREGNRTAGELADELRQSLGAARLRLPPLRARRRDIRPLIAVLGQEAAADRSLARPWSRLSYSEDALRILQTHNWMGNVQELKNWVRRLFVVVREPLVTAADLVELAQAHLECDVDDSAPQRNRPRSSFAAVSTPMLAMGGLSASAAQGPSAYVGCRGPFSMSGAETS